MPISWPWNTGRPWWPDWVISAIDGPSRSARNSSKFLERVEVGVGPEQVHDARAHETLEPALELLAFRSGLREAGREDHRELRLALEHLFERVDSATGQDDREVEVAGDVENRLVHLMAEHRLVLGVHRVEGGAVLARPRVELARHGGVGLGGLLRRADHRDRLGVQEGVEVDGAQPERTPRDVERWGGDFSGHAGLRADGDREV
jgi:hypothetical protein